jgi:hypothetical protein
LHGKTKVLAVARKQALWTVGSTYLKSVGGATGGWQGPICGGVGHNNYELYRGAPEVAVSSCGGLKTTIVSVNAWYAAVGIRTAEV